MTHDVLLLGATGNSGRLIARELAARGLSILLAGRQAARLTEVAGPLTAGGAVVDSRIVDATDPAAVHDAVGAVRVVLTTVGPFTRYAGPTIDACLAAGTAYVDISNELPAVRALLDRDDQARAHGVALVTGAGFGPGATESLVLRLVEELGETPDTVRVAAAPATGHMTPGVKETIAATLPEGAVTYVDGELLRAPLGTGATVVSFGGARRPVLPAAVGDLEAAQRASGARNVVAYVVNPAERTHSDEFSYAYAEVVGASGRRLAAQLRVGEGVRAGAAVAAETTRRVLAGTPAGAWTPGRLFGPGLFTDITGATVTSLARESA
jgi:short subunit dehydrogenase-like uncharacterized protein